MKAHRSHYRCARSVLGTALVVFLVCLLVMPSVNPSEAGDPSSRANTLTVPGDEFWMAGFNLPGTNGQVRALTFGPDGSLYAGGNFTTVSGAVGNHIARWDGVEWHPLGSGMNSYVKALAVGPNSSLYAGGSFTNAGDKASWFIAQWTGEAAPSPCCDFDGDGTVDVDDIVIIGGFWNQPAGQPYDQDGDGVITIVDIQRVARWWGVAVP